MDKLELQIQNEKSLAAMMVIKWARAYACSHCSQHCVPCLRRKFAEFWDPTGGESVSHGIPWAFGGRTGGQSDQRNLFIPTQPMWWYNTIINHNKPPSWEWFIPPISGDDWGLLLFYTHYWICVQNMFPFFDGHEPWELPLDMTLPAAKGCPVGICGPHITIQTQPRSPVPSTG
jgi:hypothetical protein